MESFSLVKKGYNPEEVDRYIATLEQVIRSYKDKDNAIKNAIISAQIAADNVIKNAQAHADEYRNKIVAQLQTLQQSVEKQRMKLQAFQDVYNGLVRKYLRDLDDNDMLELYGKLNEVENMIKALAETEYLPEDAAPPEVSPPKISGNI